MARKSKTAAVEAAVAKPAVHLNGSLDHAGTDGRLEGWCWSPDEPDVHRELALLIDGREAARTVCDLPREDLRAAGIGDGRHAFLIELGPEAMQPGATVELTLQDVASGQQAGPPQKVTWPEAAATPAAAAPELPVLHGNLDRVSRDGWVSGWCWYPGRPEAHVPLSIYVDNQLVDEIVAAGFRPDLQQAGVGDGSHGFSYALPYPALANKGTLTVSVQESGTGRNLSEPVVVRFGRMAAVEERIQDLERQLRLMRGQIEEFGRAVRAHHEDRAARELFGTVAAFFQELAEGGAAGGVRGLGLAGALDDIAARFAPLTLALPEAPQATICVEASGDADAIYQCLAALHAAGMDTVADVVLLDTGSHGTEAALLPAVVRNLRYVREPGSAPSEARNAVAQAARGKFMVFLAPHARLMAGWLDEILGTFAREPDAAVVCGRLLREDGLLESFGLLAGDDGSLRDPGHLAPADGIALSALRRLDAASGQAVAIDRAALLAAGGFSPLYRRTGHAMADLCAQLRAAGRTVLVQPLATGLWVDRDGTADWAPPDLRLNDEETLRLRERLRAEGWPPGPAAFAGHALVIDDDLPHPDRDAGSIVAWEQMTLLHRLGYRVTLCPVHADGLAQTDIDRLRRQGIEVAAPPAYGSVTEYLQAEGKALGLVHVCRHANMAMLHERIRELAPDAKLVLTIADLHFLREQRRAALAGAPAPEALREAELASIRAADATIVHSEHELELLRQEPDIGRLELLRWIVRPEPSARGFAERRDFCFVGNFRHPPNADGVLWFAAEVMPLVRSALPGVKLRLAGSDMPQAVRDLACDAIEVLGWVEDLAGLFASVRLSVAPLRYGAGFKGKVATSLAFGVPVAGSGISLEGTGLQDGDGVLVAGSPVDFAAAIVQLHENETVWQEQSARALERVTALYSPQSAEAVWRTMLAGLGLPSRP